ncbi:DUF4240 domain-containing protein [Nocardia sp. NPDC057030]|uniref:DUF4240 domain-containing protein n=1 Tax=unclassified Nocardia TaxID=2637762 RepID=UPI003637ED08
MSELPTAADETRFWTIIESAWQLVGDESATLRRALIHRDNDDAAYAIDQHLPVFLDHLRALSEPLSTEDLTALDRLLERKLYDLDRADIHEVTDGSDDGFLYCRGFIVAMGQDFYAAVTADPTVAVVDNNRVGDFPRTGSGISRESFANPAGWN